MEKRLGVDVQTETPEGGLKELVLRWFTETQAPHILNNGNFPNWFQGFTARKDAEDLLRDKALGCFLIRLSDKAIGYILSYKGHDRCRHFVITHNQDGQFTISGDCQTHRSLAELIEHYKVSPIQPFGEYLTSSCHEVNTGELYDVVNYNTKTKSGVSVQALRSLWDQRQDHRSDSVQQQNDLHAAQPPALPPKTDTTNRKLMGTVSVDTVTLSQGAPPASKRSTPLGFSLSGIFPGTSSNSNETQADSSRSETLRGNTNPAQVSDRDSFNTTDTSYPGDLCPPGVACSELTQVDNRSKSLPQLGNSKMEEEEYSNRLISPSSGGAPAPLKRVTCHTYSLHNPRQLSSSRSGQQSDDLELSRSNPLYQTSEGLGRSSAQQVHGMYAEVPQRSTPAGLPDDSCEKTQGNTYESLDDLKNKKSKSTWGKNYTKWKKFLPDYKKK
ncbi:SH2 domain-containing protein 7 [Mastacembelus armatus]|uniref:SH2 domain-containing protein 7 n=1 Tax=Mastacembelus armatus TaxID=205130 RepID=UPI000E4648DA|nr:SH2 domain-containing protein 7-like [Mastacembelus armatus]